MKTIDNKLSFSAAGFLALIATSLPVRADPPPAVDKPAVALSGGAATATTDASTNLPPRVEEALKKRQQDMLAMHELMHRIRDAKDPQEKARLMEQHLQLLRDDWQRLRLHRGPHPRPRRGEPGAGEADGEGPAPSDAP